MVQYLPSVCRPQCWGSNIAYSAYPLWLPFDPRRSNGDSVPLPLHGKGIKGEDRHPARICYSDETCHKRYKELHTVHGSCHLIHPELPTPIRHLEVIPNALIAWSIALPFLRRVRPLNLLLHVLWNKVACGHLSQRVGSNGQYANPNQRAVILHVVLVVPELAPWPVRRFPV